MRGRLSGFEWFRYAKTTHCCEVADIYPLPHKRVRIEFHGTYILFIRLARHNLERHQPAAVAALMLHPAAPPPSAPPFDTSSGYNILDLAQVQDREAPLPHPAQDRAQ
jgi:hypothetical protein